MEASTQEYFPPHDGKYSFLTMNILFYQIEMYWVLCFVHNWIRESFQGKSQIENKSVCFYLEFNAVFRDDNSFSTQGLQRLHKIHKNFQITATSESANNILFRHRHYVLAIQIKTLRDIEKT